MEKKEHASFLTQCLVLTKRSSVNMCRDLGYYWLRLVIYIAVAFGLATVFCGLGKSYSSIRVRMGKEGQIMAFYYETTIVYILKLQK